MGVCGISVKILSMKRITYLYLLFFFLGGSACESATHIDVDAVIAEKVQERLTEFKRVLDKRCEDRIMEAAGLLADSMILERARLQKDTLDRPLKPTRPEKPELQVLPDSFRLAPLFGRDSI